MSEQQKLLNLLNNAGGKSTLNTVSSVGGGGGLFDSLGGMASRERLAGLSESQLKLELISKLRAMGTKESLSQKILNSQGSIEVIKTVDSVKNVENEVFGSTLLMLPEYENQILERLKVIEEFRSAKRQLEKNLEVLSSAQKSDNPKIKKLAGGQAQSQNIKTLERMRAEVNKRMEIIMLEIIRILDDMQIDSNGTGSKETLETYEDDETLRVISTDTILKASAIA